MADIEARKLQLERDKLKLEVDKLAFEKQKFEADADKRAQDAAKTRAEALKTRIDAMEMRGPIWRRVAWVTPFMQALTVLIALIGGVWAFDLQKQVLDAKATEAEKTRIAERADLAAAQAEKDKDTAEKETTRAVEEAALARKSEADAASSLLTIKGEIDVKKRELKRSEDEIAVAPIKDLLNSIRPVKADGAKPSTFAGRVFLDGEDEQRMQNFLAPDDPNSSKRLDYLDTVADTDATRIVRLAAIKALYERALKYQFSDPLGVASLKKRFITVATTPTSDTNADLNAWTALMFFEPTAPEAAARICKEYDKITYGDRPFDDDRFLRAREIYLDFKKDPACKNALWDLADPRMYSSQSNIRNEKPPKQILLARYLERADLRTVGARLVVVTDEAKEPFDFDGLHYSLIFDLPDGVPQESPRKDADNPLGSTRFTKLTTGEAKIQALSAWANSEGALIGVLRENDLRHLRRCDIKIFWWLEEQVYVGPEELESAGCPLENPN